MECCSSNGSKESFNLQIQDILAFVTRATHPPLIGFQKQPKIQFHNDRPFPRANTCANTLILSMMQPTPDTDSYMYCLAFSLLQDLDASEKLIRCFFDSFSIVCLISLCLLP